jgi:hypothetical protein
MYKQKEKGLRDNQPLSFQMQQLTLFFCMDGSDMTLEMFRPFKNLLAVSLCAFKVLEHG